MDQKSQTIKFLEDNKGEVDLGKDLTLKAWFKKKILRNRTSPKLKMFPLQVYYLKNVRKNEKRSYRPGENIYKSSNS